MRKRNLSFPSKENTRNSLVGFCAALSAAFPAVAQAPPPSLEVPLDCTIGRDCFIQNYVDNEPGPGRRDYACGPLGYDGDSGTDFRLRNYVAMERGVAVLAAAAGEVIDTRDGMDDISVRETGAAAVAGREAGNRVAVHHGGGWITQYSHLKRGSIVVKKGDRVAVGQKLAQVGLSGRTEFPHVEMMVIAGDRAVDPFVGPAGFPACGGPRQPLWSAAALARLPYIRTALLDAGFSAVQPDPETARRGFYQKNDQRPRSDSEKLYFWVDLMGAEAGDDVDMRITNPEGVPLYSNRRRVDRNAASLFMAAAAGRPASGWIRGSYRGVYTLIRGNQVVINDERILTIRREDAP
jgi:hypothetical protein